MMGNKQKIIELINELFDIQVNETNINYSLSIVGIDSLDFVVLIGKIEKEFNIDYEIVDLEKMKTIADIVNSVNKEVCEVK
ncbi:acyl carrier protein [Clostridium beijerinckii]|uniref:acyl carrier protein n=1 Tax=Clostridium beijerinckii TaxID=1520 RepID=UPI00098C3AF6|nr:acyl carrier protein [Clostridium beijerinckii]MBA8932416.1 acyl carrier protein [Clostridium beijerinckii]NRT37614.1 acyl carrier protein [Clostridium beijerinckii]NRT48643.1 acyl carrier protein [Clostridium beijerinckii]NRU36620.1 acyl carrier protein [Clostridium beijerinckii]NRZ23061.1 acyl carrier protein [Clostridium beijerinckii]